MKPRSTSLAPLLAVVAVACGSPAPVEAVVIPPSGAPPAPAPVSVTPLPDEPADANAYPLTYPRLDEATLDRKKAALEAAAPDWMILLDPFGGIASARCRTCTPKSGPIGTRVGTQPADVAKVDRFLATNRDLLGLSGIGVTKRYDNAVGRLYQQATPWAAAAVLHVSFQYDVSVSGHLHARLPPPSGAMPDAKLEAMLHAIDPSPDLSFRREFRACAPSAAGPLEIREVACLHSDADHPILTRPSPGQVGTSFTPPRRPCVDARTGEDVTNKQIAWEISESNGHVTRTIVYPAK